MRASVPGSRWSQISSAASRWGGDGESSGNRTGVLACHVPATLMPSRAARSRFSSLASAACAYVRGCCSLLMVISPRAHFAFNAGIATSIRTREEARGHGTSYLFLTGLGTLHSCIPVQRMTECNVLRGSLVLSPHFHSDHPS